LWSCREDWRHDVGRQFSKFVFIVVSKPICAKNVLWWLRAGRRRDGRRQFTNFLSSGIPWIIYGKYCDAWRRFPCRGQWHSDVHLCQIRVQWYLESYLRYSRRLAFVSQSFHMSGGFYWLNLRFG
jgi:hypothetical protein